VPHAMLVEVCSELHIPALLSWFGGTEEQQRGIRGPTLHKRERPGAQAAPTRRSVCWGGLETDGGEAVDQAVNVRSRKGSSNG